MNRIRLGLVATFFAHALNAAFSAAQPMWAPGGVHLCQNCYPDVPQIVGDAAGGAFVAWRDARNSDDVFLQRIAAAGLIAPGWPADALPIIVDPSIQEFSSLAPDGLGGALVAWEDWRDLGPSGEDPEVQRVLANGSVAPGWPPDGARVTAPGAQSYPQAAPDGLGGVYLIWQDSRSGYDVYAQHVGAGGAIAPGWPGGGIALSALPGEQGSINFVFPDDSGGAVFIWSDGRPDAPGGYALRVNADGTLATGWPANGMLLKSEGIRAAVRDEAGGFYAVSPTEGPTPGFDGSYYLLRFRFDGTLSPGWPAGGALVCNALGNRAGVRMDADGAAGVLLCWYDYRPPYNFTGGEIFALRVLSNGTLAPGWTVNGTLLSDPTDGYQSYFPFVVHDGLGGAYVVWQSQGGISDFPSTIQHLTGSGQLAPGWPNYGLRVAPSYAQYDARIATDGQGGAIVAWDEAGGGRLGMWAQRFGPTGPTPVTLSLVSAEVEDGRVQLEWFSSDATMSNASVYRRADSSEWRPLGSVNADGTGHLRYEDRAVSPGGRYAYRLGCIEGGVEQFTAETWVSVPALALVLEGLRPNPARGELLASFTLPSGSPARLEILDVTGRVWSAREVGALGAGSHLLRLGGPVPAGMYWLRLTQGGRSLLAHGVVVH